MIEPSTHDVCLELVLELHGRLMAITDDRSVDPRSIAEAMRHVRVCNRILAGIREEWDNALTEG